MVSGFGSAHDTKAMAETCGAAFENAGGDAKFLQKAVQSSVGFAV
jgi:hypothetical protein